MIFLQNIYFVKPSKCFRACKEHQLCFAWLHLQPSFFTQKLILSIYRFILGVELLYIKGKEVVMARCFLKLCTVIQIMLYCGSLADGDEGTKTVSFGM